MFKTVIVLVGWFMVTCLAKTEHSPTDGCANEEQEELAENIANKAMLAKRTSIAAQQRMLPGQAKHCNADVVQAACYEFTGDNHMSIFTPVLLADAFNADLSSSEALLASIGLNRSSVSCKEFCHAVLDAIPVQLRPPAPQVGPRFTANGTVWDEDLSDAILEGINIPEDLPENSPENSMDKAVSLQQVDVPHDETKGYVPHNETKEMTFNRPLSVPDFLLFAAEAFEIYPSFVNSSSSSGEKKALLAEQASFDCADESIWDNGAAYIGCQTESVSGKPCIAWSDSGSKFTRLPKNYCRNPDGEPRLWCFTTHKRHWDFCEPKGAPDGFTVALANTVRVAQSWMSLSLKHFNAYHLPAAYDKWLGPSELRRKGVTKQGCTCKKSWTAGGGSVDDYCGNPDNDAAGQWCIVTADATGKKCQGRNWGYCAKSTDLIYTTKGCACKKSWTIGKTTIKDYCGNPDNDPNGAWCFVEQRSCQGTNWGRCRSLCGPACQRVRSKLVRTSALLRKLAFKFDASDTAFGYIKSYRSDQKQEDTINVLGSEHIQSYFKSGETAVKYMKKLDSNEIRGRKEVFLASAWWEKIEGCTSDILKCSANSRGSAVGTIVHETMHHFDVGFWDYLYFRGVVQKFKNLNQKSKKAMSVVRNCADCVEYFLADNNGYADTGR